MQVRDPGRRELANAEVTLYAGSGASSNTVGVARFDPSLRAYVGPLTLQRPGTFVVTAVARHHGETVGTDRQLLVVESVDPELADLQARPPVLQAVARAGEGGFHRVGEADPKDLDALWGDLPPARVEFLRRSLWDRPTTLAILLGLLVLEWSLRRWKGLA
ncbi:MAG: hypothetical protein ACKPAH_10250 [Verrucomicrobiota bacterium]